MADETKALTETQQRMNKLANMLERSKGNIQQVAAKHMTADRMIKIVLGAASRKPQLLECTPLSIVKAVLISAELGLEPESSLGDYYLVPFRNNKVNPPVMEAQGIIGYRGLINLARRSGQISNLYAYPVFQGDEFSVELGLEPKLIHNPNWEKDNREDPAKLIFVYAVARLKDGTVEFEVMSRREVDGIRARSRSGQSGPWVTDYIQMATKCPIRRLCKRLPLSPELQKGLEVQEQNEAGTFDIPTVIDIEGAEDERPSGGTDGLKATLTKATKKPAPPTLDDARNAALQKLVKAYEAIEIVNQDEQEADFARRTGGTMLEDATVAEIEAVITSINAEFDKRNA